MCNELIKEGLPKIGDRPEKNRGQKATRAPTNQCPIPTPQAQCEILNQPNTLKGPVQAQGYNPENGGATDPENEGATDPENGGATDPENEGATDPENGGATDPENEGATDPENGGATDPENEGATDPENGGATELI
ncbi:unnamed protein product [Ranitomeya imitator]|uniref:Uncharacterized protein n=1 Tax=Ranitomeya imitator TaxID=111125 RepID=A0ABN9L179_9NEOB|nr:unnamed protein product [Ranitomeya imitator]